jgi:hypothetical protein
MQQLTGLDAAFLAFETANIDTLAGYLVEELELLLKAAGLRAAG